MCLRCDDDDDDAEQQEHLCVCTVLVTADLLRPRPIFILCCLLSSSSSFSSFACDVSVCMYVHVECVLAELGFACSPCYVLLRLLREGLSLRLTGLGRYGM